MTKKPIVDSNGPAGSRYPKSRAGRDKSTIQAFNIRLAIYTLLVVALGGPAIYVWHAYQVRRTAKAFLSRADELEAADDLAAAANYLHGYLSLSPDEHAVRVRMAKMIDRGAKSPRQKGAVISVFYSTLGLVPENEQHDLRRRLAELLLEVGRFAAAEDEAAALLRANDKDPQGRRLMALALFGQARTGAPSKTRGNLPIYKAFELALQGLPGDIELSSVLARIYRGQEPLFDEKQQSVPRAERDQRADRLMDQMVEANPEKADAYLARYFHRMLFRLPGAEDDLRAALKYGPDQVNVCLAAAEAALQSGKANSNRAALEEACAHCEHVLQIAPGDERAYLLLGDSQWEMRDQLRAVEVWRNGLKEANQFSIPLHERLTDALISLRRPDDAEEELAALEKILTERGQTLPPTVRVAMKCTCDFARARLCLLRGNAAGAVPLLKAVVAQGSARGNAKRCLESWVLLGQLAAANAEWEQAAAAYEQAAAIEPRNAAIRLAAAKAWAGAERLDQAIRYGEQAMAIQNAAETQLFLADARYRQQLSVPQKERDWTTFNKCLAEAAAAAEKQPPANPWRLTLLRANALLAGSSGTSPEEARRKSGELLRKLGEDPSESGDVLQLLPLALEQSGYPDDADRAMAKLEKLPNQAFPAVLCKYQLCMLRKQYDQAREALQAGIQAVPSQQLALRFALATVALQEGKPEQTFEELKRLYADYPKNIQVLRRLVEMADDLGKAEESEAWEPKLRELEGPDGFVWRYSRARRLLAQTRDVKDPRFTEAERLTGELRALRPSWPAAHLLVGLVARSQGKIDQAVEAYKDAIRLGDRRTRVYEELVELLYAARRFAEAEEYLAQLKEQVPSSGNLSALEFSLTSQTGHPEQALAVARRGVESRPDDPTAHVLLGRALESTKQDEEAEKAFQRAIELGPTDPRTHNALCVFYVRTHRLDLAAKRLEEMEKSVEMPPAERAFVLAQGHELIGNAAVDEQRAEFLKKADDEYAEAQRLAPDNLTVLERRATFLFNRDPVAAEEVLRRMLQIDPRSAVARRMLATLLAKRGGEKAWEESQQLLATSETRESIDEQRLQVSLLVSRGGRENLLKACRFLEKIVESQQGMPTDTMLLAHILSEQGKVDLARERYLSVVSRADADPGHIAEFVDFLLRHGFNKDAAPWLDKLRQRLPENLRVLALQSRWLHNSGRDAIPESDVEDVAKDLLAKIPADADGRDDREAQLALEVGNVYSAGEQLLPAERWYRRAVKLSPKAFAPLAVLLGRQNRLREAVTVCVEAAKVNGPVGPAMVLCSVLVAGKPTAAEFELAEPLLADALVAQPNNVDLLGAAAGVRVLQQRNSDAIELYRRINAIQPQNVLALNNLASLLGEEPQTRKEAIRFIDQAIDAAGRLPALLDTKGTILVYDGRAEDAATLLREATAGTDVDPRYYFHLSLACMGTGKSDEARAAMKKAREGNLMQFILTPLERRLLQELEQKLGP